MVTIGKSFGFEEELLSSSFVKLLSGFWAKREVDNMLVSILAELNPIGIFGSLNAMNGPIPTSLTFNDVEFSIES